MQREKDINSSEKHKKEHSNCDFQGENIDTNLDKNLLYIRNQLGEGIGLSQGKFMTFGGHIETGIIYIKSISDKELINNQVISPLLQGKFKDTNIHSDICTLAQKLYISSINTIKVDQMEVVITELLKGNTAVFFEKSSNAIIVQSQKLEKRAIDKAENETTIFGTKEAFAEEIDTNISMIIKRLPVATLKFETYTLGNLSCTDSKILWIDGLAKEDIIDEVRKRLRGVNTDMIDGTSTLAELIQDKPNSLFPTYRLTERPDVVSRALSEGHVAILCNNSPFSLILPICFWDSFKTMDDYSQLPYAGSFLRITRIIAFVISIVISPLYLSFVTYNHTIVPPSLALNISQGREGVPLPSIIELIGMTIIIDIIREAGTRMPGMVGYFIGTLGAVIIGQAAVAAGYVSVSLIIVVAFSAIASFAISSTSLVNTSRIINYLLIFLAGFFGIFGFFNGSFIILWRMSILESFGVPYLYPVIPVEFQGWKDVFIRAPFKILKSKLTLIANVSGNRNEHIKKQ